MHFSLHNYVLFLFSIILTLSVATSTLCYNGQGPSHRGSNPLHKRLELEDVSLKNLLVVAACCQIAYHSCLLEAKKPTTSTQGEPAHVHIDVQVRATKEFYNFKTLCLIYPALAI